MRRAQTTVLALVVLLPLCALGLLGLAGLGARTQAEHARRLAETAALAGALGTQARTPPGATVHVEHDGGTVVAVVQLHPTRLDLPLIGVASFTAVATARATATRTQDGDAGAVLIG